MVGLGAIERVFICLTGQLFLVCKAGQAFHQQACIYLRGKRVSASQRHGRAEIVSHCEYIILLNVLDMNEKDGPGVKETVLHNYKLLFSVYAQPHSIFCLSHSASSFLGGRRWRHL